MPDHIQIAAALQALLVDDARAIAHDTQLIRRHRKLSAPLLLLIFVTGFLQHPTASLSVLAQVAEDLGVSLTPQALQNRLNDKSITFFQTLFDRSLVHWQNSTRLALSVLEQFTAVDLLDSTQLPLPDALQTDYPAAGGDGPQAALKWQVLWELLRGTLSSLTPTPASQPDQKYQEFLAQLQAGALLLFDLGYVSLGLFTQLVARQVYFVCRYYTRLALYDAASGQRLDLRRELARCEREGREHVEWAVLVGRKERLPLRLVGQRLEAAVVEKRLRAANERARKHGRQYSAEYKALLSWSLYLTNTAGAQLTREEVMAVYRLRWQVELLFKLWKSEGQIDRVAGQQKPRVLCEIYAQMIGLVLYAYLSGAVRYGERELSVRRSWVTLQRMMDKLALGVLAGAGVAGLVARLYERWAKHGLKQERRRRPSTLRGLDELGAKRQTLAEAA